ncbi:MAG TPA: hypothetical protein P5186_18110 [Candidatus Paceibacterota bacterium]|nr:hypothetical protein [Verrucomicrobiota bacterium]HRY49969.1 hypothetical protein [Candidatus Paceibacterota bacterium]HSA01148.1 hypothetical protein [Candidatus Paceibacterota bacterium]
MQLHRYLPLTIVGLALAGSAGIHTCAMADSTNVLALTTFDAAGPSDWGYGYYYGDDGLGIYEGPDRAYYDPVADPEMTNALCRYAFDLSLLPGYNNYGTGFGGPQFRPDADPTLFTSTNREDYLFSFDAYVEGLEAPATEARFEMQVQFNNSDATPAKILQVNLPFSARSTKQHFVFTLDEGSLADSSDATFAAGHDNITSLTYNVNIHVPSDAFGFDVGNAIVVDNLMLQMVKRSSVTVPLPTVAKTIAYWNMDDQPATNEYHYNWSQNSTLPLVTASMEAAGYGVGGSNAWILQMDNTELANDPPQWAGGGTGGTGPVDYSLFNTGDLTGYRLSFDARAAGLAPDRPSTTCALQLFMDAPDDTLQPADENTDADLVARLDFQLTELGTEWRTYTFLLNKGQVGLGSKTNFVEHFNQLTELRTQWQIENIASSTDWGYDADNTLVIDNFRIERLYPAIPSLSVSRSANNLVISWGEWSGQGHIQLQSAPTVQGPYTDVPGATGSPASVPMDNTSKFFRTIWAPPAQ